MQVPESGLHCYCPQDLPDGNYRNLLKSGDMAKSKGRASFMVAIKNYRTWVMLLTYGYCFGVELTMDNLITQYMVDQFSLDLNTAGDIGAVFGFMNIFTRASGGMISDIAGRHYGMRGRLWALWIIQTLGGVFCVLMGKASASLTLTIVWMIIFSICCQQACGLSYGVVPFISKRALGLVSGFVGAGGNTGAAVTQALFFAGSFE
jgi:NNP family nitrate/nitrite transporter-like MFS transporter